MTRDLNDHDADHQNWLDWRDGIPISTQFDDPYYSLDNGLAETTHVFLTGNNLPARFRNGFHVAELGFGTGLNLLTTLKAWRDSGCQGQLKFTTFEAYPMTSAEMQKGLANFPELTDLVAELSDHLGQTEFEIKDLKFQMISGDARQTLNVWTGSADAWYLDGFSPAKNPELWNDTLMDQVARHTLPSGTFATYTAAGQVRRALSQAGFQIDRIAGYGRKRHMTKGVKP